MFNSIATPSAAGNAILPAKAPGGPAKDNPIPPPTNAGVAPLAKELNLRPVASTKLLSGATSISFLGATGTFFVDIILRLFGFIFSLLWGLTTIGSSVILSISSSSSGETFLPFIEIIFAIKILLLNHLVGLIYS